MTFFDEIKEEFLIDPSLARPRRGPTYPAFYRGEEDAQVLFIVDQPEKVHGTIHNEMLEKSGLHSVSTAMTFLGKYPGYLMPHERAASAEYAKREVQHVQPKVLVAMGALPLAFCLRWEDLKAIPPVSVCHGRRFETPRGKPVIAALPPNQAFAMSRVFVAYEAAVFTLKHLDALEFSNG